MLIPTQNINAKTRNRNSNLTHCQNGHPFDEINTYIQPKSHKRLCRTCETTRKKAEYEANPDAARAYNREHMQQWRAANKERNNRNWTELRKSKKVWLDSLKTGCTKCGETHIACLEFHHRDPKSKITEISLSVARWSINRIKTEIAKCDLLCANCHRKLHATERDLEKVS